MHKRGFALLELVVILLFIAVFAGGGWLLYSRGPGFFSGESDAAGAIQQAQQAAGAADQQTAKEQNAVNQAQGESAIAGWTLYKSSALQFELQYPKSWYGPNSLTNNSIEITSVSPAVNAKNQPGVVTGYKIKISLGNVAAFDTILPKNESINAWFAQVNSGTGAFISLNETTTIAGMQGLRVQSQDALGQRYDTVYLVTPTKHAIISITDVGQLSDSTFNRILSTFRLL